GLRQLLGGKASFESGAALRHQNGGQAGTRGGQGAHHGGTERQCGDRRARRLRDVGGKLAGDASARALQAAAESAESRGQGRAVRGSVGGQSHLVGQAQNRRHGRLQAEQAQHHLFQFGLGGRRIACQP